MPVIKSNTATTQAQRETRSSDTNTNEARPPVSPGAPIHSAKDDATRMAISSRTASHVAGAATPSIDSADAATAAVALISAQVVQQPESALLGQANASADQVLALLRD